MDKSFGKLFLHISRKNDWKIGEIIPSGIEDNDFWRRCVNCSPTVTLGERVMPLREMTREYAEYKFLPLDASQNREEWLYGLLRDVSVEFSFFVREQTFEAVRKEYFPDRPSRRTCLWLADKKSLPYWATVADNTQRSLLELEVNDEVFCADDYWLAANTFSSREYEERAKHYWKGEIKPSHLEYLLCGQATIKKIFSFQRNSELQDCEWLGALS